MKKQNQWAVHLIEKYQTHNQGKVPTCRYMPTCSSYAKKAFETRNIVVAFLLSLWRILRCNPFSKGGYDPVPKPKRRHNHE